MLSQIDSVHAFAAGALLVAVVALLLQFGYRRRRKALEAERRRLEAVAVKAREMLAAAPDGLFLWDHANGGFTCSRRLAVLLDLAAGIHARYDDIRGCFQGDSLKALERAVSRLRADGTPFDLLLACGRRRLQAVGVRAETDDGAILADMVWMRDLTGAVAGTAHRVTSGNTSGLDDRHLTALLDALPLPVWLRDSKLSLAFVNRAARALAPTGADMAKRARRQGAALTERRHLETDGKGSGRLLDVTETPLGALGGANGGGTVGFAIERADARDGADAAGGPGALASALETLPAAVAVFDAEGRLATANAAYAALWGLDGDWLAGGPDLGEVLEKLRETRRLPEVADFPAFKRDQLARFDTLSAPTEELLHLPDGRTVRSVAGPVTGGGLVFAFDDVSERLDLERSVKSLDAVQRETLDNLHEGVAVFGADGRLKLHNPVFEGLWDFADGAIGPATHVGDFVDHTRGLVAAEAEWDDLSWGVQREKVMARLMSRESSTGQLELANGTVIDYANVPLPDGAMLLSYLDVTDSARVEQALRARAEALAEADRLKSEFIANVSYEIRTPVNTIVGFADILAREYFGKLNRRQREYALGILDTTRSLMGVIGDILDLASIEAGRMDIERDTVDVHGMLFQALDLVQERARKKELKMEFDCPPGIGWVAGDEKRLKQVVFNLLTNAVTFTPDRGTVRLEARREGDDMLITVADTGIGIPQADRERVFRPFDRGSEPKADKSGAGLGLSLVRNFIKLHGGTVEVKSPPGRGTTVTCRIPAAGPAPSDGATAGDGG